MSNNNHIVIEANTGGKRYWRELYEYRELFFFLAWRDILVRYKQTVIGIVWSVLRPVLTMSVLTIVFGRLAHMPSEGNAPYALLVLAGLLPWQLFSNAVQTGSESVVANASMVSKVYFPRLIFPLTGISTAIVDFLIALGIYFLMMVYFKVLPDWRIVTLPLFLGVAVLAAAGVSIFISALNVHYRDFRYVIPFLLQFGLYISPIGFSSAVVNEKWRLLYSLNPMAGVIDGFRWALLGQEVSFYWPGFFASLSIVLLMLWLGLKTFRTMENTLADKV